MTTLTSNTFNLTVVGERNVFYQADFDDGVVYEKTNPVNGMNIRAMHQTSPGVIVLTANGGDGEPGDVTVVASEMEPTTGDGPGSATPVTPRKGGYMLSTRIYGDKDYSAWGSDRSRCQFNPFGVNEKLGNPRIIHDTETWIGLSIFLASNHEQTYSRNAFLEMYTAQTTMSHLEFGLDFPEYSMTGRWALGMYTNGNTSVLESAATRHNFDMGSYLDDLGMWTDWVFRMRWNPFVGGTTSNPSSIDANGRNQSYAHDRSILQVWKTTGPVDGSGNRAFVEVTPTEQSTGLKLPIINGLDGNGAAAGTGLLPHKDADIIASTRQYRPVWRPRPEDGVPGDSTLEGPSFVWFDCIYYGETQRDGTGFSDVNPSQLAQP